MSRRIARWNKVGLNRATKHVATWLPGFGVVAHHGRRSGTQYRTPVNVFQRGDRFVIALTYGADADWVRNVLSAGTCAVTTRRRTVRLAHPRLVHDTRRSRVPVGPRAILGLLKVSEFLELDVQAR